MRPTLLIAATFICVSVKAQIAHRIITINGISIDLARDTSVTIPESGDAFTLTTMGSSGAATYAGSVLNIPVYLAPADLSATAPVVYNSGTGVISLPVASGSADGYLGAADWTTFNNKGTVTSVAAGAGLAGGTITGAGTISMPNTGTAGTYGSAAQVPVITTDAQGRVAGVSNTSISIPYSSITGTPAVVNSLNGASGALSYTTLGGYGITDAMYNLAPTAVKTSVYTMVNHDFVPADISAGGFTVNLPNAPVDGALCEMKIVKTNTGATNTLTYQAQGSDVMNVAAGATSGTLTYLNEAIQFMYKASTGIWYIMNHERPGSSIPNPNDKYLLQTADANLPNAQAMGALATGIVKNTTTTGVQGIAVAGTDYLAPFGSQTANSIYAAPNGSSGTPSFRAMAAADVPVLNQNTTGTAANITASSNTSLTSLPSLVTTGTIASGGLGAGAVIGAVTMTLGSDATGDLYYRNSSGVLTRLGIGTNTQYLQGGTVPSWSTPSGGGGGSAGGSSAQVQYNNSGSFGGAANTEIAADGNLDLVSQVYTTTAPSAASGRIKMYSNNENGIPELHTVTDGGLESTLQTSNAQHNTGRMTTNGSSILTDGFYTSAFGISGTTSFSVRSYDAVNTAPNYMYYKLTSGAIANSSAELWCNLSGRDAMTGNDAAGAGAKLTIMFCLPAYQGAQRCFYGYTQQYGGAMTTTADPSSSLNIVGVGKDVTDTTFNIMFNNGSGTATKINTFIKPNANDVYMVTVEMPSNTTSTTVTILRKKKGSADLKASATNTAKVPPVGTLMYMHASSNTGSTGSPPAAVLGIMWIMDEEYGY